MIGFRTENHLRESGILQRVCDHEILEIAFKHDAYLSGGAVRSVFTGERIEDLDISFRSKEDFQACTEDLSVLEGEDGGYKYCFTGTDAAWSYKPPGRAPMIQLICAVYGQPEEVLAKYDFTVCMGAWMPGTQQFMLSDLFLKHCAQRRLCYNANGEYPISSLWRVVKFLDRGYKLPGVEAIKLALNIQRLNLTDHRVLKRQLMGIDTMFLKEFTAALDQRADIRYDFGEAIAWLDRYVNEQAGQAFETED